MIKNQIKDSEIVEYEGYECELQSANSSHPDQGRFNPVFCLASQEQDTAISKS